MATPVGDVQGASGPRLNAHLLGQFAITLGDTVAGPWRRPPGRRLLGLVLLSPDRRLRREAAAQALFPGLAPSSAARALSQAISNARTALSALGQQAPALLQADLVHVWANPAIPLDVDLYRHENSLRMALEAAPGSDRDRLLTMALADGGALLADEPFAEWAVRARERLDWAARTRALPWLGTETGG